MPFTRTQSLFRLAPGDAAIIAAVAWVAIVAVDWFTGTDVSISTAYLLPILLLAWNRGTAWAVGCALLSVAGQAILGVVHGYPHARLEAFAFSLANRLLTYLVALVLMRQLRIVHDKALEAARMDELTGVLNRRALREVLVRELARHARTGRPLCVAYIDCDAFKSVNDRGGHAEGDRLLRTAAGTLVREVRASDLVARIGGDEFVVVFPETHADSLVGTIDKLRGALDGACAALGWPVTFSIGVGTFTAMPESPEALLSRIDALMYRAKSEGRNRVVHAVFPAPPGVARTETAVAAR
jgi:diguanylate cyclase (GGDEF)-like protein